MSNIDNIRLNSPLNEFNTHDYALHAAEHGSHYSCISMFRRGTIDRNINLIQRSLIIGHGEIGNKRHNCKTFVETTVITLCICTSNLLPRCMD